MRWPQGGGQTRLQWQALRCWRHRSAVRLRERSRKQGPRNQLQQVTNKGRQRARKTKTFLFQEAPESPWQIGGKLLKTNFTRYCVVYQYFHALCCKANLLIKKGMINTKCVNDCLLEERSYLKHVCPLSATQAWAGALRRAAARPS